MSKRQKQKEEEALAAMREFLPKFGEGLPYEKDIAIDVVRAAIRHARSLGVSHGRLALAVCEEVAR